MSARRVYLAGPTRTPELLAALGDARDVLRKRGFDVVCPMADRAFNPSSLDDLLSEYDADVAALRTCFALVYLPGGNELAEWYEARQLGILAVAFADHLMP